MSTRSTAAHKNSGSAIRRLLLATTSMAVVAQCVFAPGVAQAHTDALGFLITPSTTANRFDAQIFYGSWHGGGVGAEGSVILSRNGSAVGTVAFSIVPGFANVSNGTIPTGLIAGTNYFSPDGMGGLDGNVQNHGIYAFQSATFTGLEAGAYTFAYAPGALSVVWTPSDGSISAGSFSITSGGDLGGVGGTTPNIDTAVSSYTTTQLNNGAVNPVFTGGTLDIQSGGTVTPGFTVDNAGGTINANGQTVTFSGAFSDAGGAPGNLTLTGTGGVTFNGANTYTGDIYVNGPTLGLGTTTGAGTGTIHMVDPQIDFAATGTYVNDISLEVADGQQAADPTVLNNTSGGNITLSGRIYETAGVGGAGQYVTFSGAGTTFLTNDLNNWGGVTTVNGGTTVSGTTSSISGGSIVNNGAVIYTNASAGTATQNVSGSGTINVTGAGPVTLNGDITSTGQVSVSGAGSSLTLGGTRSGASNSGVLVNGAGATLTVADGAAIQGGQFLGVRVTGANATVNNFGTIQNVGTGGDGTVGAGVYVANAGAGGVTTVNNGSATDTGAGSLIFGRNAGVRHENGSTDTLVVNNYGHIEGLLFNGIENTAGGLTVNNFSGGNIYAPGNGISSNSGSAINVTNAGVIGRNAAGTQVAGNNGVTANGALTLNNQAGGLIIGQQSGVSANSTISGSNSGTIQGTNANGGFNGTGLLIGNGGSFTNTSTGQILGAFFGIRNNNGALTLVNAGTITGTLEGISSVGALTLTNTGTITGNTFTGVAFRGTGSVVNSGTITGAAGFYGVQNASNSGLTTIVNQSGGVIGGGAGSILIDGNGATTIDLQVGSTANGMIRANGAGVRDVTIAGVLNGAYNASNGSGIDNLTLASTGSMTSAQLGLGNDTFLYQGGTFSGLVDGGAHTGAGDLFRSVLGTGSASISLNNMANFETYNQESGNLTLTGSRSGGVGWHLLGGSLTLNGSLTNTGVNAFGVQTAGITVLGANTTVNIGAGSTLWAQTQNGVQVGFVDNVTVNNSGTVGGGTGFAGVRLNRSGTVNNNNGGLITSGNVAGASGISNSGAGVVVNNASGATINGRSAGIENAFGVEATAPGLLINNSGLITSFGSNSAAIFSNSGTLDIVNNASGTISAFQGVSVTGGSATITNAGAITGTGGLGILGLGDLTVTNSGTISGANTAGVQANGNLTLTNQASGVISGGLVSGSGIGVNASGGNNSITNAGRIESGGFAGVGIGGGTLQNQAGGVIVGAGYGIYANFAFDLANAGTVQGSSLAGVNLQAGGTVQNLSGGVMTGAQHGILSYGNVDLTNAGSITGGIDGVNIQNGASLTLTNSGTISAPDAAGVFVTGSATVTNSGFMAGGSDVNFGAGFSIAGSGSMDLTNQVGGQITGHAGVRFDTSGTGLINNSGFINSIVSLNSGELTINNLSGATVSGQFSAIDSQNGGRLVIDNAGTITGGNWGIVGRNANDSITNSGAITGTTQQGIILANGGTLINLASGVITGASNAVQLSTTSSFTNAGQIHGGASNGYGVVAEGANTTLTNQSGGVIDGWRGVLFTNTGGVLSNAGAINGGQMGVLSFVSDTSVTNTGTISATSGQGVYLNAGGSLTNSGTITGGAHGFLGVNGPSTVDNLAGGVMTGTEFNAVYTGGAGSVITNAGLMNGGNAGVYTDGANTVLTNTGTIRVTGTNSPTVISGVYMAGAGSSVTNSGTIESTLTDGRGVFLAGGSGSIVNQSGGVISGNGTGDAIVLTGADYTVDLDSGSTVNGLINAFGSTGTNTLTVAGDLLGGYVGGTGADNVTLVSGMNVTGVLNGMDGVDSLVLTGSADWALDAGLLGGFESRTMNGTGAWTLSGVDGDTSTWTLNSGDLRLTGNQSVNNAAGIVVNAGGTLSVIDSEAIGALSGTGSVVISDLQALLVGADDSSSTFDGVISGLGGLQHVGTGVLTLTGANTYTGATVVQTGTLQLGASGVIADTSDLSVLTGATFDMQGFDETVRLALLSGTLAGTGTLTGSEYQLNGATVNANLGAGNLFNVGGVSVLNGTSASQAVTVLAGTLTLGAADRLSDTATLVVATGATFDLDGHDETVGLAFINGTLDGFGVAPPPPAPPAPDLWEGKVSSDGPLVIPGIGNGTLTAAQYVLDGATINANLGAGALFNVGGVSVLNGLAGAATVSIQGGTLQLGEAERLSDTATLSISAGATLDLDGHDETVGTALISGTLDGFGMDPIALLRGYDKTDETGIQWLPGIGVGTLTATEYQLNGATINGNLGTGNLFNVGGVSVLNGTAAAGLVSVQAGTLQLGASNRLSNTANLSVSTGATLDLQGFSDTVALALLNGTLAGTGTLTAGEYQLNGATINANLGTGNLFNTGGVSVMNGTSAAEIASVLSGTLRLGASDRLNNAGDLSVSSGATFDLNGNTETVRGLFGMGDVTIGAGRLTFGGIDSGFGGRLSGSGSLVHTGGVFTLMNTHTLNMISNTGGELRYLATTTGNVNVSGGSMTGAGTIGGALTVSNGATLSPGLVGTNNGIGGFQVGSLVMNGGRLALDVLGQSGGSLIDQLVVTGTANLTGGIVAPTFSNPAADYNFSTRYQFVTAGTRVGQFANGASFTAGNMAGLFWRVRYDLAPNSAVLELRRMVDFDPGADGTTNQREVAGGLSEGQLEGSDDWTNVISLFDGLDADDRLAAFDSTGGEAIADMSTSLLLANDKFLISVREASGQQAAGATAMNFAGTLGFVGAREGETAMVANVLGAFDPMADGQGGMSGGWVSAYAADVELEGKPGTASVETRLNGVAGGLGLSQGDISVGVAAGVTRMEGDVSERTSTYESDLTHGAGYMRFDDGTWAVGLTGTLYGGQVDSRREITVGAFSGLAVGSTDAEGRSISASIARRFRISGDTTFALGLEGTASVVELDAFTETGAGGLSLEVSEQKREWQTTVLSGRGEREYRMNGRDITLYGGLGAMLTTGDRQAFADMRFSGAAAGFGDFTIEGAETSPMAGVAEFGVEADTSDTTAISVGYRGVFSERLDDHQLGARFQIRW